MGLAESAGEYTLGDFARLIGWPSAQLHEASLRWSVRDVPRGSNP